jgi:hypothetical protein
VSIDPVGIVHGIKLVEHKKPDCLCTQAADEGPRGTQFADRQRTSVLVGCASLSVVAREAATIDAPKTAFDLMGLDNIVGAIE